MTKYAEKSLMLQRKALISLLLLCFALGTALFTIRWFSKPRSSSNEVGLYVPLESSLACARLSSSGQYLAYMNFKKGLSPEIFGRTFVISDIRSDVLVYNCQTKAYVFKRSSVGLARGIAICNDSILATGQAFGTSGPEFFEMPSLTDTLTTRPDVRGSSAAIDFHDQKPLAAYGGNNGVVVWNYKTDTNSSITLAAFDVLQFVPHTDTIAISQSDGQLWLWDYHNDVTTLALSLSNRILAAPIDPTTMVTLEQNSGMVTWWNIVTGVAELSFMAGPIDDLSKVGIAYSDKVVAVTGTGNALYVWERNSRRLAFKQSAVVPGTGCLPLIASKKQNELIVLSTSGQMKVFNVSDIL